MHTKEQGNAWLTREGGPALGQDEGSSHRAPAISTYSQLCTPKLATLWLPRLFSFKMTLEGRLEGSAFGSGYNPGGKKKEA